ncbi:hypothetical protein BY458DRAFT_517455 [Sporodiniella umbellata]|nr:hypothetical protein BY458DRAFT_517455 [Sporodiniella umbellata]
MSQDAKDPYRVTKKLVTPDGSYKFDSEAHSESSSFQAAEYVSEQDPYMPQRVDKKGMAGSKRANSYLPYSHHGGEAPVSAEGVYLEEELPSFERPAGSLLHDTIAMTMMEPDDGYHGQTAAHKNIHTAVPSLIAMKKKRWWTRVGISGRKLVFFGFLLIIVVILIWFFVWPRVPTLQYTAVDLDSAPTMTNSSIQAVWRVNFTVLNGDNWIPTRIQNFAVQAIDTNTEVPFGWGDSGRLMLTGQSIDQVITIPVHINYTSLNPADATFQHLSSACSIVNQDLASPHTQTLGVKFKIVYSIAGIVWHPVSFVSPATTHFQCPTNI